MPAQRLPVRELLHTGRGIRVFGTREGTRLVASGVELYYEPPAPAPGR